MDAFSRFCFLPHQHQTAQSWREPVRSRPGTALPMGARGVRVFICIRLQSPSQQPLIWFDVSFNLFPGRKPFILRRQFPAQLSVTLALVLSQRGDWSRAEGGHYPALSWVTSFKSSSEAWQLTPET